MQRAEVGQAGSTAAFPLDSTLLGDWFLAHRSSGLLLVGYTHRDCQLVIRRQVLAPFASALFANSLPIRLSWFCADKVNLYNAATGFQPLSRQRFVASYTVSTTDPEEPQFFANKSLALIQKRGYKNAGINAFATQSVERALRSTG